MGGFALAAFAKAGGLSFLGQPRTPAAAKAQSRGMLAETPLVFLALCVALAAVFAPALLSLAGQAALNFPGMELAPARVALGSALAIARTIGLVSAALVVLAAALLILRNRLAAAHGRRAAPTWGCAYTASTARIQYSADSFVEPTAAVMPLAMGLTSRLDMDPGYFPIRARLTVASPDGVKNRFFTPIFEAVARGCDALKVVQHGRVHLYILYVLATVVALLAWKL